MRNLLPTEYLMIVLFFVLVFVTGCGKYLEAVPDKSLTVPKSVADYQALLESEMMFTEAPALGQIGSDDLYLPDALWETQALFIRDAYCWNKDLTEGNTSYNWNSPYQKIYNANVVLDGIVGLEKSGPAAGADILEGWALYCRAAAFYDLQELFGQPYRPASANSDLGIPLRLNTQLEEKTDRATVSATFQQILDDLGGAIPLLPASFSKTNRNRPVQAAALGLMARVYLTMQNYAKALQCADQSLQLYSTLIDYNTLDITAKAPFSPLNDEVICNGIQLSYLDRDWQITQEFYQLYTSNDLRKTLYFTVDPVAKSITFKGFYSATATAFAGVTTDEMYLIKAECEARTGQNEKALSAINSLLVKRFKTGTYIPYVTNAVTDVLSLVLSEKRKECLFRNLRWSDLRRLNQDVRFAQTITRVVKGITYQLPPNDLRYTLLIPEQEIRLNQIPQNPR